MCLSSTVEALDLIYWSTMTLLPNSQICILYWKLSMIEGHISFFFTKKQPWLYKILLDTVRMGYIDDVRS